MPRVSRRRWCRTSLLSLMVALTTSTVRAEEIDAAALALVIDGEPAPSRPTDSDRRDVWEIAVPLLRNSGFAILPTAIADELIGGEELARAAVANLSIDLRPPDFTFNVVLLPPRWSKTKVGELRLERPGESDALWSKALKVRLDIAERDRREHALKQLRQQLAELRPARRLRARTAPDVAALLELNDIAVDETRFLAAAEQLAVTEATRHPQALVGLAASPRLRAHHELRVELIRRAVVDGGAKVTPALGRGLLAQVLHDYDDMALTELLAEAIGLVAGAPGEALAPHVDRLDLAQLLDTRRRFATGSAGPAFESRIADLAIQAVDQAGSFIAAERLIQSLPLESLSVATRTQLRDALYARITTDDASQQYARVTQVFPESDYPPPDEQPLDDSFLAGATAALARDESGRLAYYEEYLRSVPRARAAPRLAAVLGLDDRLRRELASRLRGLTSPDAELAALRSVFGPHPGPDARAAFGQALVAGLGPHPTQTAIQALHRRHPDEPAIAELARDSGWVRSAATHSFPVAIGDSIQAVTTALGSPSKRRDDLARRDLSPAAVVGANQRVPRSRDAGLEVLEYDNLARIVFHQGTVYRLVVEDTTGRFHHGIRLGDRREDVLGALGEPSTTRSLMYKREILVFAAAHGQLSLTVVLDKGRVVLIFEEDAERAESVVATLW